MIPGSYQKPPALLLPYVQADRLTCVLGAAVYPDGETLALDGDWVEVKPG